MRMALILLDLRQVATFLDFFALSRFILIRFDEQNTECRTDGIFTPTF